MARNALGEQADELGGHEVEAIGDVEADDPGVPQVRAEPRRQPAPVRLLHDEDDVGPGEQLGRHRRVGVVAEPGGSNRQAFPVGEDLLGGRAAQAVASADEEDVQDGMGSRGSSSRVVRRRCDSANPATQAAEPLVGYLPA